MKGTNRQQRLENSRESNYLVGDIILRNDTCTNLWYLLRHVSSSGSRNRRTKIKKFNHFVPFLEIQNRIPSLISVPETIDSCFGEGNHALQENWIQMKINKPEKINNRLIMFSVPRNLQTGWILRPEKTIIEQNFQKKKKVPFRRAKNTNK